MFVDVKGAKKLEFALILDLNTDGINEVIGEVDRFVNEGTRKQ